MHKLKELLGRAVSGKVESAVEREVNRRQKDGTLTPGKRYDVLIQIEKTNPIDYYIVLKDPGSG